MKKVFPLILVLCGQLHAQSIEHCRQRFDKYLNFKGTLGSQVLFEDRALFMLSGGKKILSVYEDELPALAHMFEFAALHDQKAFMKRKGLNRLTPREKDSLLAKAGKPRVHNGISDSLPLRGYRIALDPGHFGTTLKEAEVEQKFLYFVNNNNIRDTILLFESTLNFNTATILKGILEEQGAEVFVTRDRADFTSFNCTFGEWMQGQRRRTLDSLRNNGELPVAKYKQLLNCTDHFFFWNFFRDYDLANRARRINAFDPHVSLIIHYNVDEKNIPWKKESPKNYAMAFIGGAYTAGNLQKTESRMHLLRMLLTDQLDRSEKLAGKTVSNFNSLLSVPVAGASDALYLRNNCMPTASPGVFCRNLALCRTINSPLVYGESLYQDNEKECRELMKCDVDMYGVRTSGRLVKVANCYYNAVFDFLKN